MKLSISWIFDHIDTSWGNIDINNLITKFNQTTAEIEHSYPVNYSLDTFYLAQKKTINSPTAFIHELNKEISLPDRKNTIDIISPEAQDITFLVKKRDNTFSWATLEDFGVDKGGFLPAIDVTDQELSGSWRDSFEHKDIILEVDNKSITHRPDMWGHRGFAREIAAFLDLKFLPKENFLQTVSIKHFDTQSETTSSTPFVIHNQEPELCSVFNGLYFPSIQNKPTTLFLMSRLLKVDSRPINCIIDLANYVTLDWSQPVHTYDTNKITDKKIIIRKAQPKEELQLLDENNLKLDAQDLVIANNKKPMCLAGVKGGLNDSVSAQTSSIFFESANFDAAQVRKSAARHKTRTDSSARFEKTLDPNQAIEAIFRFLMLAKKNNISFEAANEIMSVGNVIESPTITLSHAFLEQRIGQNITQDTIKKILEKLEFVVSIEKKSEIIYHVTIPTFRARKDITIKEDILEEIVRSYGFEKINLELPRMQRTPFDLSLLQKKRIIRNTLAYAARMIEQQNYSFYNEQFLTNHAITQPVTVKIVNPVTENYQRLVASLIPGLLKNIQDNFVHHDTLNFFEFARTWSSQKTIEKHTVSGIFFEKHNKINFYTHKEILSNLFSSIGFNNNLFVWKKIETQEQLPEQPWYQLFQSVQIFYESTLVGHAGMMQSTLLTKITDLSESTAFIFELDGDFLLHTQVPQKQFKTLSRYQDSFFDLSLMVPLSLTTNELEQKLSTLSQFITHIELIDFFEKKEWDNQRSLTFRIQLNNPEKTLEKQEIETIWQKAITITKELGAQVRS